MYPLSKLKKLEKDSNSNLSIMKKLVAQLADRLEVYNLDASHSEAWIKESIEKDRADALPGIQKIHKIIKEIAEELQVQKEFWESTPLVLSQQRFIGNDEVRTDLEKAQDSAVRLSVNTELSGLPENLIELTFRDALQDGNFAMVYQCYLAGQRKDIILNLQEIDIPNQLEALLAIENSQLNSTEAEFLLQHGGKIQPEQRLNSINDRDEIQLRIKNIKNRIKMNPAATEKPKAA